MKLKFYMHKLMITIAWIGIFSAIGILVLIGVWLLKPYDIATVKQPFEVLNKDKIVNINSPLKLRLVVEKKLDIEPTVYPAIRCESGNLITLVASSQNTLPVGKYDFVSERIILPPKFQVGDKCQYVNTQVYDVNPLRDVTYQYVSEYFTVGAPL